MGLTGPTMGRWWIIPREQKDTHCNVCEEMKPFITETLSVCVDCIRETPSKCMPYIYEAHRASRVIHGLPSSPPKAVDGVRCGLCANQCSIGDGEKGFCGIRWNQGGMQSLSTPDVGLLHAYLDPHITNCCGAWFCPGGTGAGYPEYSYRTGLERGYQNLSVFFYGCNFNCLYCQNSSHKNLDTGTRMTADEFANAVMGNPQISCICFFGGSPEPQLPFAVNASKKVIAASGERILRICFEWNGCGDPGQVREAAQLSLSSGGNTKFDLKCYTPSLSVALSSVDNRRAYENFRMIGEEYYPLRPELPVLTATTLMVTGYVDSYEVDQIAGFIADIDTSIPYSLLVFHPDYRILDLPVTPVSQAVECYKAAANHLENVNIGNLHSLGIRNMDAFRVLAEKAT